MPKVSDLCAGMRQAQPYVLRAMWTTLSRRSVARRIGSVSALQSARTGNTIYFQSYMRVLRDASGQPQRLYGLTLDVTTFKETEAANAGSRSEPGFFTD